MKNIVGEPDFKFLSRPTRRWANISSTLERLMVLSQSSFDLESLPDKGCKVRTIMKDKFELYIRTQSFSEFLLFASIGGDVSLIIAGDGFSPLIGYPKWKVEM